MSVRRISIDESLPKATANDPGLAGKVKALSALKAVAVGLDQVVNRCQADLARWGHVDPGTQAANEADFVEARKQLHVLEAGLETGRAMLAGVESQPGVAPEPPKPAPSPKAAK